MDDTAIGGMRFDEDGNLIWFDKDGVTNLGQVPEYDWSSFLDGLPTVRRTITLHNDVGDSDG
jgi:hypothetical protein